MENFDWLWQSAAFEVIWKLGVLTLGGFLLTWLKANWPKYGPHLQTFLITASCLGILWFTFTGGSLFHSRTSTATIENDVKGWADKIGVGIAREQDAASVFMFTITLRSGNHVLVAREKDRDQYLIFQGTVIVAPEHQAVMSKLSADKRQEIVERLTVALAASNISFSIDSPDSILKTVAVRTGVPITPNLTEDVFAAQLDRVDDAMFLTLATLRLNLAHGAK